MATDNQIKGEFGEKLVAKSCNCPKCKHSKTLQRLPANFKCADVICDFCGFIAQVKTCSVVDVNSAPNSVMGAAWAPQKARMDAGIYFPLYIVAFSKDGKSTAIYYLSADLQEPHIFQERPPLKETARRAGWIGFNYRLAHVRDRVVAAKADFAQSGLVFWFKHLSAHLRRANLPNGGERQADRYCL